MPRDKDIKVAFEVADDGMQGVLGYFLYGLACKQVAPENKIAENLPEKAIQITHSWIRYYSRDGLIQAMNQLFEPYHARVSLISIISIFEGALARFIDRLTSLNKIVEPRNNYKARLGWAFNQALQSTYYEVQRIPDLCLDIDHARRIRNLWMHNNGLFDNEYNNSIAVLGRTPIIEPSFLQYQKDMKKKIPFVLNPDTFLRIAWSHIELLHQLHHYVQKTYFNQQKSYSYKSAHKQIEWYRLLIGI